MAVVSFKFDAHFYSALLTSALASTA